VKRRLSVGIAVMVLLSSLLTLAVLASDAQMYFSSDKNGQNRVTNIREGDEIFIVVIDNDENIDCDVRDKIWTDVKIMDPKTGAYIIWRSYIDNTGSPAGQAYDDPDYVPHKGHWPGGTAGWLGADYLEETGADTGVFVSTRAFRIGTREDYDDPFENTHVVDNQIAATGYPRDFQWGGYSYMDGDGLANGLNVEADDRNYMEGRDEVDGNDPASILPLGAPAFLPSQINRVWDPNLNEYLVGRFENMDSLIGMYQDQNDATDVAVAMMKIVDVEATISWDQEVYKDANGAATITVVDPDENLDCSQVEYVPVFIIVNPGSWNPVRIEVGGDEDQSPTNFCMLKWTGGVAPSASGTGNFGGGDIGMPLTSNTSGYTLRWYNMYSNYEDWAAPYVDGAYYMEYPRAGENDAWGNPQVSSFATVDADGFCRVSFHAQETGVDTGVFQLNLNTILDDLGFERLNVRDVLVAYYLDPNDQDDFKLATAYIEERQHSITSFTDATRADQELYWIGRDAVYVQVIDANANVDPCCPEQVVVHICDPHGEDDSEFWILDETSSNSPVFFSNAGMVLRPVWDALGIGLMWNPSNDGGFQLQFDNWKLEAFNEDSIFVRYNDVYYTNNAVGLLGLGDMDAVGANANTPLPPRIDRIRVANDVSFDLMEIADTQVYGGTTVNMYFLDRQGNRVSGYVNSDCVFIEVIDPDQDEDQYRRERIDAFWDLARDDNNVAEGGQNTPFGPIDDIDNHLACGFEEDDPHPINALLGDTNIFGDNVGPNETLAKLYVLNPRNGHWAAVDLLETGVSTGDFVSVICIDLVDVYECVPSLYVQPGDTIVAVYQDPSNHSDSAWISIKVGIGGGGTPPTQASTTMFVDADGNEVANYTDADTAYVKVIDPSHAGATLLANAVEIDGTTYDLEPLAGAQSDTFITAGLNLALTAGTDVTATYTDPTDPTDTSSDTITVIASELDVVNFYAGPNPFDGDVTFGFVGTGIATTMEVVIYDASGHVVWAEELANVTEIVWDGTDEAGNLLANGAYIYVITATDGTNTFTGKDLVFVNR